MFQTAGGFRWETEHTNYSIENCYLTKLILPVLRIIVNNELNWIGKIIQVEINYNLWLYFQS